MRNGQPDGRGVESMARCGGTADAFPLEAGATHMVDPSAPVSRAAADAVGASLTEEWGEYDRTPAVFVRTLNGRGTALLDRHQTLGLYNSLLSGGPLLTLWGSFTIQGGAGGETDSGFSWIQPGARPALRHVVRPLRVAGLSGALPVRLGLELHWTQDRIDSGGHRMRSFTGLFPNCQTAHLAFSCLWSSPVGRYADRATIVYPDRSRRAMETVTKACDLVDRALIEVLVGTMSERVVPPHEPGRTAAHQVAR